MKQAETDYHSLQQQVRMLQQRYERLREEKDQEEREYKNKVNGQERHIEISKREKEEVDRLLSHKEKENEDLEDKL